MRSVRAETALAQLAREKMHRLDDARSLIRQLFRTEVDLIPDPQNKTLTVRLHPLSAEVHDQVVRYLCEELTSAETVFSGADLRLIYTRLPVHADSTGSGDLRLSGRLRKRNFTYGKGDGPTAGLFVRRRVMIDPALGP